jgi:uncharacterized protein YceK
MANRLTISSALTLVAAALSGCGTVTDLVTSHVPERYSGRASIVVDLGEQEAYLYREKHRTASSTSRSFERIRTTGRVCTAITSMTREEW